MPGITDVPGVLVGHAQNDQALTGCTAVLTMDGAVAGVDVRGSAPGTRETDLMRPCNLVERVHAVVLAGGSAYGLDAACGAMQFLEERGVGFATGSGVVPIVGAAVIFDLDIGDPRVRPDKDMGYAACAAASAAVPAEGNVGAGLGATVGKAWGLQHAMKGGVGTWSVRLGRPDRDRGKDGPVVVGAIAVVNALGDVIDPDSGQVVAGAYDRGAKRFLQAAPRATSPGDEAGDDDAKGFTARPGFGAPQTRPFGGNTTLAVVATNARLDKEGANKVAQIAHDGLARVIRPVHTMYDGDVVFALSTGNVPFTGDKAADITFLGAAAADAVARAILRAVSAAAAVAGVPAARNVASRR
ncbi:MAG: P1 family peptidase [Betaproteobacteria bacterium]